MMNLLRWMLFVDGENLAINGKRLADDLSLDLKDVRYFSEGEFLWLPPSAQFGYRSATDPLTSDDQYVRGPAQRSHYYTCVQGAADRINEVEEALWKLSFSPTVFRKPKGKKGKGVDIALTRDLLCHAFRDNYDVAVVVSGDGDYVPVVEEVKRIGKRVHLYYFPCAGLSSNLRLVADHFIDLSRRFELQWKNHK